MSNQTKLIAIVLVAVIIAGGAIAAIMLMQPTDSGPSVDIIDKTGTELEVTLSEMKIMSIVEREGSFQNSYGNVRGQGTYKGIKIADLIDLVGDMETDEVVIVNATDGYSQIFSYHNVHPNDSIYALQGDLVLAFSYNGTEVPDYEEGYRILFLPEDGYFSNDDANASIDSQFFSGAAGPKCVSNVATIQIADRPEPTEPPEPSILDVKIGSTTESFIMSEILEMNSVTGQGGFKNSYGTIVGPFTYTGVPLYNLLMSVASISGNYEVQAIASDDYTVTYNQSVVEGTVKGYDSSSGDPIGDINCTMLLAYYEDGEPVEDGPLRIVFINDDGNLTDSFLWAKMVVNLTVIEQTILNVDWEGEISGFTMSQILGMTSVTGEGGYKKKSGTISGPDTWTGVPMLDLLSSIGTLVDGYSILTIASDEWETEYNQTEVEGHVQGYNATTGESVGIIESTMILAYYFEGVPVEDGPFRIAFISDEGYVTDSFLWSKFVVNITVVGPPALYVSAGGETEGFSMHDLMNMHSVTGSGGYVKSSGALTGPYNYTGVTVEHLLSLAGTLPVNYSLQVVADDGYKTYFNYSQIEVGRFLAYNGTTGNLLGVKNFTVIVAYYEGGAPLPSGGPLRIVLLNDEGFFSDGHWWAKYVVNITVIDETEPWELELHGVEVWNMTYDTYYSLASCEHHRKSVLHGDDLYEGVPLHTIVAAMDGGDDEHYLFNTTLLLTNYNVTLYDSNGNNVTFNCWELTQNNTILIAGWANGQLLSGDDWPLKLVSKNILLGNIVKAEIVGWDT